MANPSGRAGRDGEHTAVGYLAEAGFPGVEREGRRAASLDVVGPSLTVPVEVKRRKVLAVPEWTRTLAERHEDEWALFIIQRDARRKVHPDMMVVPAEMGAKMLRLWELYKDDELFYDNGDSDYYCNHSNVRHLFGG